MGTFDGRKISIPQTSNARQDWLANEDPAEDEFLGYGNWSNGQGPYLEQRLLKWNGPE